MFVICDCEWQTHHSEISWFLLERKFFIRPVFEAFVPSVRVSRWAPSSWHDVFPEMLPDASKGTVTHTFPVWDSQIPSNAPSNLALRQLCVHLCCAVVVGEWGVGVGGGIVQGCNLMGSWRWNKPAHPQQGKTSAGGLQQTLVVLRHLHHWQTCPKYYLYKYHRRP